MGFWADRPTLAQHIDQHRAPEAREWVVPCTVGDKSASFETCLLVVPHDLLVLRRIYLHQPSNLPPDSSAFWALAVVQRIDGKDRTLATLDGARYGLVGDEPKRLPAQGDLDAALVEGWPVYLVGVKAGSPSNIDDLHVSLVMALR